MACLPNILSLLAGNVGLKRWDLVSSTNFAASGLEIMTQGQPNAYRYSGSSVGTREGPLLLGSKEDIWVLGVELEGFTDVRPAESSGRKRRLPAIGFEEITVEENEEEEEEDWNKETRDERECHYAELRWGRRKGEYINGNVGKQKRREEATLFEIQLESQTRNIVYRPAHSCFCSYYIYSTFKILTAKH
ncbi:hypothetical protein V6N13_036135 [Hibiscus sabdariffa]